MIISGSSWVMPNSDMYISTGNIPTHNLLHTRTYYNQYNRSICEYCHGYTEIDKRGNCCACGAPKLPEGYLY